ncbi:hypothetical protein DWB85_10680 [Seongchinamella sediminis]|uniref:CUB domain-containing protein n=1 Tax=Seongchinamella sediminis TaxID=2283635 RepID=A0A3L7DW04_9GAMM|nr:S8 family serine peptidase [Seongchinamella sediminis]RLQ21747.1 hypothetical protein DWB85_10680 [Seongchinamella sediminis]
MISSSLFTASVAQRVLLATLLISLPAFAQQVPPSFPYLDSINAPAALPVPARDRPVVIAVVDDGVLTTHRELRGLIWANPAEIAGNGVDDDGNGLRDDWQGWDVADNNALVTPPAGRPEFYHGTHLAGVIARIVRRAYGEDAGRLVRIMPVKVLQDAAPTTDLKHAYQGVEYAIAAGADIILSAWGMAALSPDESRILDHARDSGILVIASAGNYPDERDQFPAAHPAVLAVSSVDGQGRRVANANFGPFVDIAAPGNGIEAAGIASDTAYQTHDGTSGAAAMVAAAAAMVQIAHPGFGPGEVTACLLDAAQPLQLAATTELAKMGSGSLDIQAALACELLSGKPEASARLDRSRGYLHPAGAAQALEWVIAPAGNIKGLRFAPVFSRAYNPGDRLEFRQGASGAGEPVASFPLSALPEEYFLAGDSAHVSYLPAAASAADWLLGYRADTVDTRTLYCRGTTRLMEEGEFTDGSGEHNYSYNTDCKWLITAPPGKRVQFRFSAMDTETRRDLVYFFNGAGTHEDIMAIFSGRELPPELTTWSNQVLVWFVTDGQNQGRGWRAQYRFIDPAP